MVQVEEVMMKTMMMMIINLFKAKSVQEALEVVEALVGMSVGPVQTSVYSKKAEKKVELDKFALLYRQLMTLDTGCTHNMSCNSDLTSNIKKKNGGWHLFANTGTADVVYESNFPGIEEKAMHDEKFFTNILSFGLLRKLGWWIEYKYDEDVFLVSNPNKNFTIKFESNEDLLYVAKPGQKYLDFVKEINEKEDKKKKTGTLKANGPATMEASFIQVMADEANSSGFHVSMVQTLKERLEAFTEEEIKRGRKARKLYHAISAPSMKTMKKFYDQLHGNDVPWKDVELADKMFGWDISTTKGRWVKKQPKRVVYEEVEIPRELIVQNSRIELCIDLMFIKNFVFLTAIDKTLPFRSCLSLPSRASKHWATALKLLMRKYNMAGFFC